MASRYSFSPLRTLLLSEFIFAAVLVVISAGPALASQNSSFGAVICVIAMVAYGQMGRAIAIIAVMMVGLGAMFGKVSWSMALLVATGIGITFGAPGIVSELVLMAGGGGGAGASCG